MDNFFTAGNLPVIIAIAAVIIILLIIASGYVKAPPDIAFIISGFKKEPKVLIGRAGIKIPFLERMDKLSLKQITIDVKTEDYIPTLDFINIQVDAVVKVRVSTDKEGIKLAMKNFLNKKTGEIVMDLQDSLQGNMREIIGTLSLKDICNNRDEFGNQVQSKAKVDMEKLGIEIISCNIQNVTDRNNLIEDMGMDNTAKIKKDASIAKAEADRDVAIAQSNADKEANDARIAAETEIAKKNNELSIQKAELKKLADVKQAEADAAYEIQKQEQRKTIEIANANADIARQEREVELKTKEAQVKEQELSAVIKKKADADKYASQQAADVELYKRQKEAEAKKYEAAQAAEAKKLEAEALKFSMEQEAAGIEAKGVAEAAAIQAKAEAEAAGIDKKAEAMQKYGEAAVIEMLCKMYPEVAAKVAEPLKNIDSITMYGEGNTAKMTGDITRSMTQIMKGLGDSLGFDPSEMLAKFVKGDIAKKNTDKDLEEATTDFNEVDDSEE